MTPEAAAALHARCIRVPRPWTAAEFAALLSTPGVFLVGGSDALAVGRVAAREAELLTIATAPEHRRQGLGRRTLAAFEAEATRRGAVEAFLEVAADNAPALALYRASGWGRVGRRPGYYRDASAAPADALILRKSLGPV